ncbi:hypothetical protein CHS0354_013016 [Potamilus streckersoni]|uniref:Solute carrier family 12 member 2 n=1 Tax=Potamilus streckersoni TaxID=2493646 RepID=A0AAE0SZD5_9BIVA|nr:hypothetical protein CHS0354_013016 [Potamilus streckersoni]
METPVIIIQPKDSEVHLGVVIEESNPKSGASEPSSKCSDVVTSSDREAFISAIENHAMERRIGVTGQHLPKISLGKLPFTHVIGSETDNNIEKKKAEIKPNVKTVSLELCCTENIDMETEMTQETSLGFLSNIDNSEQREVYEILDQKSCLTEESELEQSNRPTEHQVKKVSFKDEFHPDQRLPMQPCFIVQDSSTARKISTGSYGYYFNPGGGTSSLDAVYLVPPSRGHKVSVFSLTSEGSIPESERTFNDTIEALPHVDHYRDLAGIIVEDIRQRPTLYQLREKEIFHEPSSPNTLTFNVLGEELVDEKDAETGVHKPVTSSGLKFGWIQGVLIRCLLNIFGVMLFLRLTWIAGQAGVGLASVIVLMSSLVTTITTMSMSAICTNGEVKGGGAYYMISRSLGPEFGGAIGVVFSLASALGAAMHIVGFAETVRDLMWEHDTFITGDLLHEVRIIGAVTCVLLVAILLIGMEWEAKAQLLLLVILTVAIFNYFVGTFLPPSSEKKWKGVVGYNAHTFTTNFGPGFTEGNSFFSVFAIFFPSATGILAGANMSGDLKDPQKAIPKGTFLAILITSLVYLAIIWTSGGCLLREAVGPAAATVTELVAGNLTTVQLNPDIDIITNCFLLNGTCKFGTLHDNGIVGLVSPFRPLIIAGIFSATLSSALASMLGAPKVFQALGKDDLFPCTKYFSKGYGPGGDPRKGYILAFAICLAATCIGSLDIIAPIISNFFLMAYALINYSCFNASIANTPGFRPAFRYYNKWISLMGAMLCFAFMFLSNWWAALVTFVIVAALYVYVKYKKPDVNWGSSTQANAYKEALKSTLKLVNVEEHVKNFRPQILALTGFPSNRADLVDFCSAITKRQSLLACGHVFEGDMSEHVKRIRSTAAYSWFKSCKVKAFYNSVAAPTFRIGVQVLLQAFGLGKLHPNTIILGFKSDWQTADPRKVYDYYHVIQDAFDLNFGVGILSIPGGCDCKKRTDDISDLMDKMYDSDEEEHAYDNNDVLEDDPDKVDTTGLETSGSRESICANSSLNNGTVESQKLEIIHECASNKAFEQEVDGAKLTRFTRPCESNLRTANVSDKPPIVISDKIHRRFRNIQYGTIDVWWLYDDGGLTLLIPYILSQRKQWKNCKLRVFCIGTKKDNAAADKTRMATLLGKFRIEYSQLTIISDLSKKPQLSTYKDFESLIYKWRLRQEESHDEFMWKISDTDLICHKERTYRNLRLREELKRYSTAASLIVMSLPTPRKVQCPAGLYMGWLEILTRGMPPILLLRGNQQSVLTYYS